MGSWSPLCIGDLFPAALTIKEDPCKCNVTGTHCLGTHRGGRAGDQPHRAPHQCLSLSPLPLLLLP